ncbi:protein kinase domain-containing protein [Bradyrhizobium sp. HKCCYLS2038]|uniref:protein kinase domain-containing protein n=1 Tax=unclassified Bradyrhizobium TaxID=2631580 RepID=UPI003EBEFEBC
MSDIRHTFFARPQTRLAPPSVDLLAGRRVQDTVILNRTMLVAAPPTLIGQRTHASFHELTGRDDDDKTRLFARPLRSDVPDDAATVLFVPRRGQRDVFTDSEDRPAIRKSLPVGSLVHRYRIEKVIGEGGFGITYSAEDTVIRRRVALKELFLQGGCYRTQTNEVRSVEADADDRLIRWASYYFSEEARITFALRHEGVVRIQDFFRTNNTAYIVYEMIDGADMRHWAEAARGSLAHSDVLGLLSAAGDALAHVHSCGFLHRDVKPANVLIANARQLPILIDFGAAIEQGAITEGEIVATPGYAPPEQYSPETRLDPRCDIYALCATFYWLLSGQRPQDARERQASDDLQPLRTQVDRPLRFGERLYRVIDQGLSLDPAQRYDSVTELLDDLFPKTMLAPTGYAPRPLGDKIFLSYRRSDSAHFTGRLLDFLEMRFGPGAVFVDAHSIPPGSDFWDHIKDVLCNCAIQLVIIGPGWTPSFRTRRRRWYQSAARPDYIIQEIAAASELQIPILPILFDGAGMPNAHELPPELQMLPNLNASVIGSADVFRSAAENICDHIAQLRLTAAAWPR